MKSDHDEVNLEIDKVEKSCDRVKWWVNKTNLFLITAF